MALDIGSSKISVVVSEVDDANHPHVIGIGKVAALGIRKGCVQDVEPAVEAIRHAVQEAEQTSRCGKITSVFVSLTGKHLHSINREGRVVLQDNEISEDDVKKAMSLAGAFDKKSESRGEDDRVVFKTLQGFTIDDDDTLILDPIGMSGSILTAHVHLSIGSDSIVRNLIKCIRKAGVDVEGLVLQSWASAASCLTPTEKKNGVILLDIGAGVIDIACFKEEAIQYSAVATEAGDRLSADIATVLSCTQDDAEEIKRTYGRLYVRPEDKYEEVHYRIEGTDVEKSIGAVALVQILEPRMRELLTYIGAKYLTGKDGNWLSEASAGIVITGGCAKMYGMEQLAAEVFRTKVRIGEPHIDSMVPFADPENSTVAGVVEEILRRRQVQGNKARRVSSSGLFAWLKRLVVGDFAY